MDPDDASRLLRGERRRIERVLGDLDAVNTQSLSEEERSYNEDMRTGLQDELAGVERAEARLANGTYGLSVESGELIPDARLHIFPAAERTEEEQERFEQADG